MLEFLSQTNAGYDQKVSFTDFSAQDADKIAPESSTSDDRQPVRIIIPPEIIVPDSMKFWVMIICFIGSAISNIFGWKKKTKRPK
jgi:hypothetical protein